MFYYEIPWFNKILKGENLCSLNLYSVHAARILDLSLESSQMRNETPIETTLKAFPS